MRTGLKRLAQESVEWVVRNPVLILIVLIIVIYDEVTGTDSFLRAIDWTSGHDLLRAGEEGLAFALTPLGAAAVLLSILVSTSLTMLTVGISFSVFADRGRQFRAGMRSVFSPATLYLFFYEVVTIAIAYLVLLLIARGIVATPGGTELLGAAVILLVGTALYMLLFMIIATASVIFAARVSWYGRLHLAKTALTPKNLSRLIGFYMTRVGLEGVLIFTVAGVAEYFAFPPILAGLLLIAVVTLPFALIRTSGFILKFDIFKDDVWFRSFFRAYYERSGLLH